MKMDFSKLGQIIIISRTRHVGPTSFYSVASQASQGRPVDQNANVSHFQGCSESPVSETRRNRCLPGRVQARLQQYMNRELPDVQAGFRKGRGTRDQIANIRWIIEKARKTSISVLLTLPKPLTVWITINCGKF